jgi:pimeloyl-ACP methyl ester carboxylesterase
MTPTARKHPTPWVTGFSVAVRGVVSSLMTGMWIFALAILGLPPSAAVPIAAVLGVGVSLLFGWADVRKAPKATQAIWLVTLALLAVGFNLWAWFTPLTHRISQYRMPVNGAYWTINGQRIAYRKFPAGTPKKPSPVIFLHGGPGGYAVQLESVGNYFGALATLGFDVYLYDQIGSGLSDRLTDPNAYTVQRMVSDLERIRVQLNADRLVLIGESWGGTLASSYLAAHPTRVERMVLISPGELDHSKWDNVATVTAKASPGLALIASTLTPKMAVYNLLKQRDVSFAKAWIPDREIDSFTDGFFERMRASTVCDQQNVPETSSNGFGAWALEMTSRSLIARADDPKAALKLNPTPTLILKGKCDFMIWDVAREYRDTLPKAQLAALDGGGHVLYWEEGRRVRQLLNAFLRGRALPIAPYTAPHSPYKP